MEFRVTYTINNGNLRGSMQEVITASNREEAHIKATAHKIGASKDGLTVKIADILNLTTSHPYYETIVRLEDIIEEAQKLKNAYFFTSPRTSKERRRYEEEHSWGEVRWEENSNEYTAEFKVECTGSHIYAKGYYTKNGNKTNLTAIKNSLKRLKAMK